MTSTKFLSLKIFSFIASAFIVNLSLSCKNKKADPPPTIIYKTDPNAKNSGGAKKAPIINITDTILKKQIILYMKDSAASSERIGIKLGNIYGNVLADVIKQNKLKRTGSRMVWYKTSGAPFLFEAGIPVDKKPAKLPKKVFVKNIGGDSAVIAHFYGPYSLTFQGYEALRDWLKSRKKRTSGPPYEVYIGEAIDSKGKAVDPYLVQTDIIFPHH